MQDWEEWLEHHGWLGVYGMAPELLRRALEAAYRVALMFDASTFPPGAFGSTAYNWLHHELTVELLSLTSDEWRVENRNNFMMFAAPEDVLFVYPTAARGHVGRDGGFHPSPSNPKGPVFDQAVQLNSSNGELFPEFDVGADEAVSPSLVALLHQFNHRTSTIYAELATPVRRDGRLLFEDRFFLEPIVLNDVSFGGGGADDDGSEGYDDDFDLGNG